MHKQSWGAGQWAAWVVMGVGVGLAGCGAHVSDGENTGGGGGASGNPPAHTVVLHNRAGTPVTAHPLRIGQAFAQGEVPSGKVPQLRLDGQALDTQAEVPLRWADGSVRFAVLSAVVPSLGADASRTLTFAPQTPPAAGTHTLASLLSQFPDFEVRMRLSAGGVTRDVSARDMLAHTNLWHWVAQGPQRYSVVVADHTSRSRDFGFDGSHTPLRPMFHIDFWPGVNKVQVRAVVESPNLDALQDVSYDVAITSGLAAPTTVWSKTGLNHYFGTRWSQTFWVGGAPATAVDVKHSVAYWAYTGLVPNMNPDATALTSAADTWRYGEGGTGGFATRPHDVYETGGLWNPGSSHLSDSIGHMPAWAAAWLKTGDYRLGELTLALADLADAWPVHFREHDASLFFDRSGTVSAQGRRLSLNAHPALWFPNNNGEYPNPVGTRIAGAWDLYNGHQPEPYALPYLLTGDGFYLDALQAWVATQALKYTPGAYGRGEPGYGGMGTGADFAGLGARVLAATLSPDGSAEKRYFHQLVLDALAFWAGQRGVSDATLQLNKNYAWAATQADYLGTPVKFTPSPLGFWGRPVAIGANLDQTGEPPFINYFLMAELGFARDLGFPTGALLGQFAPFLTGQIAADGQGYDARYLAAYRLPSASSSGTVYSTWASVGADLSTNASSAASTAVAIFNGGYGEGYAAIAAATAGSYLSGNTNGAAAWSWLQTHVVNNSQIHYGIGYDGWRLLPRTSTPAVPPAPDNL